MIDNTNACQVGTKLLVTDIFLHISNKIQIYLILISELFIDISIIQYIIVQRRRRIIIRHHKKVYLEAATPESRSYVMENSHNGEQRYTCYVTEIHQKLTVNANLL